MLTWQAGLYLEPVHKYLWDKQEAASDLLEKSHEHLDRILEIIGSYEVVPSDMVIIMPHSPVFLSSDLLTRDQYKIP